MRTQALFIFCSAVVAVATAQCLCGCVPPPPPKLCLPAPNPYDAIGAIWAIPSPVPPPPELPPAAPTGNIIPGCGPAPTPLEIIQAPCITIPGPASDVIELPAPALPAPQVIAHKCVVNKVVQKPQVYQRLIQVPTVARFLKKAVGNVVENIAYTATPKCGPLEVAVPVLPAPVPCLPPPPPCGCCY